MTFFNPSRRLERLAVGLLLAAVFVAGFALGSQQNVSWAETDNADFVASPETQDLFKPVLQAYTVIHDRFVDPEGDPLDDAALVNGALRGMMETLGDRWSYYIEPARFEPVTRNLRGEFVGIGVVVNTIEETGEVRIDRVLPNSPAALAGMQRDDIFVGVDGKDVTGVRQDELVPLVRGEKGTSVTLTMRRGGDLLNFTMTRAAVSEPSTEWRILDDSIGYFQLKHFSPGARAEIDEALTELNAESLNGLILDLRGNSGGTLGATVAVASAFLEDSVIFIEDFGGRREEEYIRTDDSFSGITVPMVVLVDEGTQSAAEATAGAFKADDRATLVGETTFGKGTVQRLQRLVNGGGIRLTVARWMTPDRQWIHDQGITPDIVVEWNPPKDAPAEDDPQLQAAVDFLTNGQVTPERHLTE